MCLLDVTSHSVACNFNIFISQIDLIKLTYNMSVISNKTIYVNRSCELVNTIHR